MITRLKNVLLDLLYPRRAICMGCGTRAGFEREWLCDDCRKQLAERRVGAFPDKSLEMSAAAYYYAGPAGSIVRNMKYRKYTILADMMAKDMADAYRTICPTGAELIVPVPMHKKRLRKRGFNQSQLLARKLSDILGMPYSDALVRVCNTPQQAKLEATERVKNVKNAFAADESVKGRNILLVDDVLTTGATARECANTLKRAGAGIVSVVVYAKGGSNR